MHIQILLLVATAAVLSQVLSKELMSEVLKKRAEFITFNNLLKRTNLTDILDRGTNIVFGISDAAFSKMPQTVLDRLFDNNHLDELTDKMKCHIVPWTQGEIPTHWSGETLPTLANMSLRIATYPHINVSIVSGVPFDDPMFNVSNGKLFSLKGMLSPPSNSDIYSLLLHSHTYNSFLTAATLAGMVDDLKADNITVFAPTDDAFAALQTDLRDRIFKFVLHARNMVKLHIVQGTYFTKGLYNGEHLNTLSSHGHGLPIRIRGGLVLVAPGGTVIVKDWMATNGVVQSVSAVVVPHTFHYSWWG